MPQVSKPLTKKQEQQVLSMFTGSKQRKGIHNGRVIAENLGLPRRRVMEFLNSKNLTRYSEGSYSTF